MPFVCQPPMTAFTTWFIFAAELLAPAKRQVIVEARNEPVTDIPRGGGPFAAETAGDIEQTESPAIPTASYLYRRKRGPSVRRSHRQTRRVALLELRGKP